MEKCFKIVEHRVADHNVLSRAVGIGLKGETWGIRSYIKGVFTASYLR